MNYRAKAFFASLIFGPASFAGFMWGVVKTGFSWGMYRSDALMDDAADAHERRVVPTPSEGTPK